MGNTSSQCSNGQYGSIGQYGLGYKQLFKTDQTESQGLRAGQGSKKPSLFRKAYNKKLRHAPQTQSKASKERALKNLKLPHFTHGIYYMYIYIYIPIYIYIYIIYIYLLYIYIYY